MSLIVKNPTPKFPSQKTSKKPSKNQPDHLVSPPAKSFFGPPEGTVFWDGTGPPPWEEA